MILLQKKLFVLCMITNRSAASATVTEGDDMQLLRYLYMNYGATQQMPDKFDCTSWVDLFAENGTWTTPLLSVSRSQGDNELADNCTAFEEQFSQLTAFEEAVFPIVVNQESLVAFSWRIAGVLNGSGRAVSFPAITTWNLDDDSKILSAVDYYDMKRATKPVDPLESLRYRYMNFGATEDNPDEYNCTSWVNLFTVSGTSVTPNFFPAKGPAGLQDKCTAFTEQVAYLTAFEEVVLPVGDVQHPKRVAFSWRLAGVLAPSLGGGALSIPAITTWLLDDELNIVSAWDYYDPNLLTPIFVESRADQPVSAS